jgi:hypothetical protein
MTYPNPGLSNNNILANSEFMSQSLYPFIPPLGGSAVGLREGGCEHAVLGLFQQPHVSAGRLAETHRMDRNCAEQVCKFFSVYFRVVDPEVFIPAQAYDKSSGSRSATICEKHVFLYLKTFS